MNFQVRIHPQIQENLRVLSELLQLPNAHLPLNPSITPLPPHQENIKRMVINDVTHNNNVNNSPEPSLCLGLQRKASLAGLNWSLRPCSLHGGYVCKRPKETARQSVMQNQTVVGSEGRLISPGYPNAYPPNVDYSVKISGPERSRLIVQFQRLDLEYQDECLYDYVSVRDFKVATTPATVATSEEKRFDPGTNPVPLAMFRDDGADSTWMDGGFHPHPSRQAHLVADLNEGRSTLRRIRKKRYMANYMRGGRGGINNNNNNGGRRTGNGSNNNNNNGAPSFQPYVRWCGALEANMSRFDFISKGNQALLHFHSDYAGSGTGFAAIWTAVDITGCPVQTITSRTGTIQSPNHPYFLLNNLECTYIVQAPLGRKVWIEFTDFDVRDDALVLVDLGDGQGDLQPFVQDRVHSDGAYLSRGERMRVTLRTGAHPEGRGFKLAFRTVGKWKLSGLLPFLGNPKG